MFKDAARAAGVGYASTLPRGPGADVHAALLSDGQFDEAHEHNQGQMAAAATLIAADLISSAVLMPQLCIVIWMPLRQLFQGRRAVFETTSYWRWRPGFQLLAQPTGFS